ncbi:MAG TPA: adenylate/guanylate cyclase domain-containing protein [Actinomycetota bacterium]
MRQAAMADPDPATVPSAGQRRGVMTLLERLAEIGVRPEDSRDERLRAGALILTTVGIAVISLVWVVTYLAFDEPVSAAIPAAYQVVTAVGLLALARTRRFDIYRTTEMVCFLVLPALLQASLGGFVASSGMILWAVMTPLAALAMLGWRRSLPWLAAFFVVLALLVALDPAFADDPAELPRGLAVGFFALNITGVTLGTFVMLGYFVHQRELTHAALELEQRRSERLLLNVLPEPIADRLKQHEGVIAERHDDVTVLFADLVGFTALSVNMDPETLVSLLDEIFTSFDRLVDEAGLEKIKTIGDAYMVAGGLPRPRHDHAEAVAAVGLAMLEEVAAIEARFGGGSLSVRIGIDTGPVVAGVIGRRKFIYDMWGDTVNTASRMESHGVPGRVQVTARVASRLERRFVLEPCGEIDVKGKGPMEAFLLGGPVS